MRPGRLQFFFKEFIHRMIGFRYRGIAFLHPDFIALAEKLQRNFAGLAGDCLDERQILTVLRQRVVVIRHRQRSFPLSARSVHWWHI